jgi:putative lipoprotein
MIAFRPQPRLYRLASPSAIAAILLLAALPILLTTGCANFRWPWGASASDGRAAPPQDPMDKIHRGTLILGDVVRSFTPCGETRAVWVIDETDGLLDRIYAELNDGAAAATYVEFRGAIADAPAGPAARGYEGQITVRDLIRAEALAESRGCNDLRPRVDFRAWGNEPFWSVELGSRTIVFRQPDEPSMLVFPPTVPELRKERMVFNSTSMKDARLRIKIILEPIPCRDTMSGAYTSWTAAVELFGRTFRGCAVQGWGQ